MRVVGDLEANGLLQWSHDKGDPADTIWCGVFKDLDTQAVTAFLPHEMEEMIAFLSRIEFLAGHNFVDYDVPLMKKILNFYFQGELFDTFIVSQLCDPDRPGGHGLAAWGERFGIPKPEHEDWSQFSPEMLYRCEQDVEINYRVYLQLLKELGDA